MRFVAKPAPTPQQVRALTDLGCSPVFASLLAQRGLTDPAQAERFLHPGADALLDPMTLWDMDKAAARLKRAIDAGERVVIYGDYDADGVTAVSVLMAYLACVGFQADYYIPARHEEGYGLNAQAVRTLAKDHTLLVTVDCGIASHDEVALATELGMDVIVTDHHQLKPTLPQALAVVNPLLGDYACPHLCGAGVALKLVQALGGLSAALEVIDLAAIGTVADIVPLTGENRVIATLGIEKINRKRRVGIDALCQVARLGDKPVDAGHIGFLLGPRINAGGRIDRSGRTVELMLTENRQLAAQLAAQLEEHNAHRQQLERAITAQCEEKLSAQVDLLRDRAIVLWGEDWNVGVVGIVASRMTEKYTMPCILFARDGDRLTGSGRSVRGVHLLNAITACSDCLTRYGGHEMAAGLSMEMKDFESFRRRFNEYLRQNADPTCFEPTALYDAALTPGQITAQLCRELTALEPCGMGNPTPQFLLSDVELTGVRLMGQERRHVRAMLGEGREALCCVAFSMADCEPVLRAPCDMLVQVGINAFGGVERPQAIVRKVRPSDTAFERQISARGDEMMRAFFHGILRNEITPLEVAAAPWPGGSLQRGDLALVLDVQNACACSLQANRCVQSPPRDPQAFPALVVAPNLDEPLGVYRRFVFADGMDTQVAGAIVRQCPDATFFVLPGAPQRRAVLPGIEGMRRIFSEIRRRFAAVSICPDESTAARQVAPYAGVPPLTVLCALMVFAELGFVKVRFSPWSFSLCPDAPRRELTESRAYRYFRSLGEWEPERT